MDKSQNWFVKIHEELVEVLRNYDQHNGNLRDYRQHNGNEVYIYDITTWRNYHNIDDDWIMEDIKHFDDYWWLIDYEFVVSSEDLPIEKLAYINLK